MPPPGAAMSAIARQKEAEPSVLSLAQLLEQQPPLRALLDRARTLAATGNPVRGRGAEGRQIAAGRQPRAGAGSRLGPHRLSHPCSAPVLVCQFELPVPQFVGRLATMRRILGNTADQNLFVDTRATGHLLNASQGLNHFLSAARAAAAEIIILDPLYSTHDQDENDTRAMAACARACCACGKHARRSDRGASRAQIHRPLRDRQRLPRLQRPARRGRQLSAADQTRAAVPHRRTALPVSLRRSPTTAPARTRSRHVVVLSGRTASATAPARRKVEAADIT